MEDETRSTGGGGQTAPANKGGRPRGSATKRPAARRPAGQKARPANTGTKGVGSQSTPATTGTNAVEEGQVDRLVLNFDPVKKPAATSVPKKPEAVIDPIYIAVGLSTLFALYGKTRPLPVQKLWLVESEEFDPAAVHIARMLEKLPPSQHELLEKLVDPIGAVICIGAVFSDIHTKERQAIDAIRQAQKADAGNSARVVNFARNPLPGNARNDISPESRTSDTSSNDVPGVQKSTFRDGEEPDSGFG